VNINNNVEEEKGAYAIASESLSKDHSHNEEING
jgi:hypothetical protein